MRLQQIGADDERAAVTKLGMRHLQLDAGTANDPKILAPIELKGFARCKGQRHEGATPGSLLQPFALLLPGAGKSCHPVVGPVIAKADKVTVQLLHRPALLARPAPLSPQPRRKLLGIWVQLAWPVRHMKLRLNDIRAKIFADRVPRHTSTPRNLPDRHMLALMPPADNAQKRHVQHSVRPRHFQTGKQSNMGQISVEKSGLPGSLLSGNQHCLAASRKGP